MQPFTYANNAQVPAWTNLASLSLILLRQSLIPATFDNLTALTTDPTATTSLHALRAIFLHLMTIIVQDADKQVKLS